MFIRKEVGVSGRERCKRIEFLDLEKIMLKEGNKMKKMFLFTPMKKMQIWLLAAVLVGSLCFLGGRGKEEAVEEATPTVIPVSEMKIGFANLYDGIDFCAWVKDSMKRNAEEYGVGEIIFVDNEADGTKAIQNIDTLISAGVHGIIEYMNDATVNLTVYEMAQEAGIPVVAVDIPVGDAPYCGGDNYTAGKIAGIELGKAALERWNGQVDLYISVETMANLETNELRQGGFIDGIREVIDLPDDIIVKVDAKDKMDLAQRLVTDVLTAHPDDKHILIGCHQDDETQGAFAAVEMAGRQDEVLLAGQGPFASTFANLCQPEPNFWIGSTSFAAENYGNYAIPLMIDLIQGKDVPKNTLFEHYFLTWENVDEHYPGVCE